MEALLAAGFRTGAATVLLDVPVHRNIGDSLIALGEYQLLAYAEKRLDTTLHHVGSRWDDLDVTLRRIPDGANVLLHGGGNFGDMWPKSHEYRLTATAAASSRGQVIWLPQSMWFLDDRAELADRTQHVLDAYRPSVLIRDHQSVSRFSTRFGHDAVLCPDLGMCADVPLRAIEPGTTLELVRRDQESTGWTPTGSPVDWEDAHGAGAVRTIATKLAGRAIRRPPSAALRRSRRAELSAFRTIAETLTRSGLDLLGEAETIHTDRLHAAVLALLSGGKATVRDNVYAKVSSVLNTWSDFIHSDRVTVVSSPQKRPGADWPE